MWKILKQIIFPATINLLSKSNQVKYSLSNCDMRFLDICVSMPPHAHNLYTFYYDIVESISMSVSR